MKTYLKTAPFLSKCKKTMAMHVSTGKEANESLNASQSSSYSIADISICDSDEPPMFPCEKKEVDKHEFATTIQPSSSSLGLDNQYCAMLRSMQRQKIQLD